MASETHSSADGSRNSDWSDCGLATAADSVIRDLEQPDNRKGEKAVGVQIAARASARELRRLVRVVAHLAQAHR